MAAPPPPPAQRGGWAAQWVDKQLQRTILTATVNFVKNGPFWSRLSQAQQRDVLAHENDPARAVEILFKTVPGLTAAIGGVSEDLLMVQFLRNADVLDEQSGIVRAVASEEDVAQWLRAQKYPENRIADVVALWNQSQEKRGREAMDSVVQLLLTRLSLMKDDLQAKLTQEGTAAISQVIRSDALQSSLADVVRNTLASDDTATSLAHLLLRPETRESVVLVADEVVDRNLHKAQAHIPAAVNIAATAAAPYVASSALLFAGLAVVTHAAMRIGRP